MNTKIPAIILAVNCTLLNHYLGQILKNQGYLVKIFDNKDDLTRLDAYSVLITDYDMISALLTKGIIQPNATAKVIGFVQHSSQLLNPKATYLYGLLESSCDEKEFLMCVEQVLVGKLFYSSSIIRSLNMPTSVEQTMINTLTKREKQILILYSKKHTMAQIAECLHISQFTVNNHLANIRAKLKLEGPNSLVRFSEHNRSILISQAS